MKPLVSVIIPTMPGRERFLELAIACFRAQDYENKEILVDKRSGSIGHKRNRMCEEAHGDIIVHFDDDDWSSPARITRSVEKLSEGYDVVGTGQHFVVDLVERSVQSVDRKMPRCGSLAYWRIAWQNIPFPAQSRHEAVSFLHGHRRGCLNMSDPTLFVQFMHGANTAPIPVHDFPALHDGVRGIMGDDLDAFLALTNGDAQRTFGA